MGNTLASEPDPDPLEPCCVVKDVYDMGLMLVIHVTLDVHYIERLAVTCVGVSVTSVGYL